MLMAAEDVDVRLNGTLEQALKLRKPRADEEIAIASYGKFAMNASWKAAACADSA